MKHLHHIVDTFVHAKFPIEFQNRIPPSIFYFRVTHPPDELLDNSRKENENRTIITYLGSSFPSSPTTCIHFSRRDALLYAHGEAKRGWRGRMAGDIKLPTFDRISDCTEGRKRGGGWLNSMGGLNGIPLEHREGPRRSVKGCISSATTLFVAGQSDYAEKFRYATILREAYTQGLKSLLP